MAGWKPVLVDVNPKNILIDIKSLKKKYKILNGNQKEDLIKTKNALKIAKKLQHG